MTENNTVRQQADGGRARAPFDVAAVREDFPILGQTVHGQPLVYLDNAASSQMPRSTIDRLTRYHASEHSNVHRGVHCLSQRATDAYEETREKVRAFIGAAETRECVFVRGTTEAINLVMHGYGRKFVGEDDAVVISAMEHHSNLVPWQMLCEETGADLRIIPINDSGELVLDDLDQLLEGSVKLVAVNHVSNALGTVNPVEAIIAAAHARNIPVLLDGAQAVPHMDVDVQALDCDFYAFSGHKMFGPTGIGVLYGKAELLEEMQPYQGGGDMILSVSFEETVYNEIPFKFEAGTPSIAASVGLGASIDYLEEVGMEAIAMWEAELLRYATEALDRLDGVRMIGTAERKASVLSFVIEGVHPHDVGTVLDQEGVAIRAGHHCAQPVMTYFGVPATARASLAFYNTFEDIDALVSGIQTVRDIFG